MRRNHTLLSAINAISNDGIPRTYSDTFSSKNEYWTVVINNCRQSRSAEFKPRSFTGKERDEETGYSYFRARYMDHEILTSFLSVDRYADKYPSISPYAYCAWNPIKLIDPTGDTIVIKGSLADNCVEQLRSKHLNISRDSQTGVLSASLKEGYSEKELFDHEAILYEAICGETSKTCNVEITAERTYQHVKKNGEIENRFKFEGTEYSTNLGGSAMGTEYNAVTEAAISRSFIDPILIEQNGYDQGVAHEVIEAYILSFISTDLKIGFDPAFQTKGKPGKDPLIRTACKMTVPARTAPGGLHEFGAKSGMIEHLRW